MSDVPNHPYSFVEEDDYTLSELPPSPARPTWSPKRFWLVWLIVNTPLYFVLRGLDWAEQQLTTGIFGRLSLPELDWLYLVNGVYALLTGLLTGFVQWLLLRRPLPALPAVQWLSAILIGVSLNYLASVGLWSAIQSGSTVVFMGDLSDGTDNLWLSIGVWQMEISALNGLIFAVPQWVVLRHYIRRAGWYVIAHMVISSAIAALHAWNFGSNHEDPAALTMYNWLLLLVTGPLNIVVVGGVLALLLNHRRPLDVEDTAPSPRALFLVRIVIGFSFFVGLLLWFFYITDYSLVGNWGDVFFPPLAFVLGLVALDLSRFLEKGKRLRARISATPAIIGGLAYLAMLSFAFMSPNIMGALFMLNEVRGERLISSATSPDGTRIAEAYYRPAGVFIADTNAFLVRVKHTAFPIIERDIVVTRTTSISGDPDQDLLKWDNNDILEVPEVGKVSVGIIQPEWPQIITLPIDLFIVLERTRRTR